MWCVPTRRSDIKENRIETDKDQVEDTAASTVPQRGRDINGLRAGAHPQLGLPRGTAD